MFAPGAAPPGMGGPGAAAPGSGSKRGLAIGIAAGIGVVVVALVVTLVIVSAKSNHKDTTAADTVDTLATPATTAVASTSTQAPTTAPPTTVASGPGIPVLLPGVTDPAGAVPIIQKLASALAAQDWATARAVRPGLASSSDSQLASGYGGLDKSTVIALSVSADGTQVQGAYLAWETVGGNQRTSIYCTNWTVNPAAGTVTNETSQDLNHQTGMWSSWEDPAAAAPQVQNVCHLGE